MSRLLVVRHGQASFFAADYDRLSSLGIEQARLLGEYWAGRGVRVDRAFVGPRRRHRETHDAVAAAFAARGLPWPAAAVLPELDEHHGPRVVEEVLRVEAEAAPPAPVLDPADAPGPEERQRQYLRDFARVTRRWARAEIALPGVESWQAFRARVERGVGLMCAVGAVGADGTAVAFTSGGPVAATAGLALALTDEKALELSWAVSNGSVSEFVRRDGHLWLSVFNAAPHLTAEQASMV